MRAVSNEFTKLPSGTKLLMRVLGVRQTEERGERTGPPALGRVLSSALLLLALTRSSGVAQAPAQRIALAHFRDSIGASVDSAWLHRARERAGAEAERDPVARLRLGAIQRRLGEFNGQRSSLDQAVREFAAVAGEHPDWPEAWYGIALTKLALYDGGYTAKAGPFQRTGTSYLHGAADAFIRALEADPAYVAAAERLTTTVLRETFQPQFENALPPLQRVARVAPAAPAARLALGLVERELGHTDSAAASFARYLGLGGDSAVGDLELARTLFQLDRGAQAESLYYAGSEAARSPAADAQYRSDLAWVATPEELAGFDRTSGAARAGWLRDFWRQRDVRDGRRPGERLAEHYRRLSYVMKHFRLALSTANRVSPAGSVAPAIARAPNSVERMRALLANAASKQKSSEGTPGQAEALPVDNAIGVAGRLGEVYARLNDQSLLRAYYSTQSVVDDRGVIYVRHGPPDKRATYAGADADPNESWLYDTPGGPRIFHFTGVAAPTTLIEHLPLNQQLIASRAGLDPRYTRMAAELDQNRLEAERLEEDRRLGHEAIEAGTTTDSYRLRFERRLTPVVQMFGVRRGLAGQGRLLVLFAVKGAKLPWRRVGPDSVIAYPMAFRVIARNSESGAVYRTDTTRVFATHRVLGKDEFLTGQMDLPIPADRYQVQVVMTDEQWDAGAVVGRDSVVVPDLETQNLSMSDVVLGRPESAQRWIAPPDTVPLNALNAYPVGSRVGVYYQVGGLVPSHEYETRIDVRKVGAVDHVGAKFRKEARASAVADLRAIELGRLSAGAYSLTVTVEDVDCTESVSREHQLNVTES